VRLLGSSSQKPTTRFAAECLHRNPQECLHRNPQNVFTETHNQVRRRSYKRTFSRLPKVIQVRLKLQKQKDFCKLINRFFNQNIRSLLLNDSGGFGHKCRRLPQTPGFAAVSNTEYSWYQESFLLPFCCDPTTSWHANINKQKYGWYKASNLEGLKMSDFSWFGRFSGETTSRVCNN